MGKKEASAHRSQVAQVDLGHLHLCIISRQRSKAVALHVTRRTGEDAGKTGEICEGPGGNVLPSLVLRVLWVYAMCIHSGYRLGELWTLCVCMGCHMVTPDLKTPSSPSPRPPDPPTYVSGGGAVVDGVGGGRWCG